MPNPLWRIYYPHVNGPTVLLGPNGNPIGSTFDNSDGAWAKAPLDGIVCVNYRDPGGVWGRRIMHGCDHYWIEPGDEGSDGGVDVFKNDDLAPTLRKLCPWIKYGVYVKTKDWQEIMLKAFADPDFPKRSPRRRASDWKAE